MPVVFTYAGAWGPEPFLDGNGNAVTDATIRVYEADGTTLAGLFTSRAKNVALANPLPVGVAAGHPGLDSLGNGSFYADPGAYVLAVERRGTEVYRATAIVPADPAEAGLDEQDLRDAVDAALAGEVQAREGADTALGDAIAVEVLNREDADSVIAEALAARRLDQAQAPTADVSFNGHRAVLLADPVSAQDAATRAWVLAQLAAMVGGAPGELDSFLEAYDRFLADEDAVAALTAIVTGKQPSSAELTALAALTSTPFGRHLLELADGPAVRTAIGAQAAGTYLVPANIDDTAYDATSWDADTTHAPSKNAVRDKIESLSLGAGDFAAVVHGSDSTVARPSVTTVLWIGTVQPDNIDVDDVWFDTDAESVPLTSQRIIRVVIDGGGSAIAIGTKKVYVSVPYACTIRKARLLADQSGSIVLDVWKDTYANFPPTVADTITASAKPTLSSATKSEDSTLTGWTKTIAAGDILEVKVDSAATVTKVYLDLFVDLA